MEQVSPLPELPARPEALPGERSGESCPHLPARLRAAAKPLWREWVETLLATLLFFRFI